MNTGDYDDEFAQELQAHNMKDRKTYLFLDDDRMPWEPGNYMPVDLRPMYRKENWQIVRNFEEFRQWILDNGLPDVVSFDHDLGKEHHYKPDDRLIVPLEEVEFDFDKYEEKTGYHCAKWMVEFCMHEHLPLPEWYVHSANVVGAENIKSYIENYQRHAEDFGDRAGTTSPETGCTL
jgi:hypothetical protein